MTNEIDWQAISAKLREPFNPDDVDFRPQGNPNNNGKAQAVCYIDARAVADRLDDVVGPGAWSFTYEPLVIDKGQIQIAKGRLTIHGVTKEDVGEASNFDASKGCVSDALKRAAVLWGIGRYLYDVGGEWVTLDQYKRISREDVQRLRGKLPRPASVSSTRPASPPARREPPQTASDSSPRPQATPAPLQTRGTQDAPAVDPMALTHASALDQKRLYGQMAARFKPDSYVGFLKSVTERDIDPDTLRDGRSDLSLDEFVRASERLTRPAGNGKGAAS